jgi:hypothetical protein
MDVQGIQMLKAQLNETRRWFYTNAKEKFGVDITGIPLPRVAPSVSGGFQEPSAQSGSYDYLEPTAYDSAQVEASGKTIEENSPLPKLYVAMSDFLQRAVQYLEARESIAGGEIINGMDTRGRNLQSAFREVERLAQVLPIPEESVFTKEIAQHAKIVHMLVTSDKPVTFEALEMRLAQPSLSL